MGVHLRETVPLRYVGRLGSAGVPAAFVTVATVLLLSARPGYGQAPTLDEPPPARLSTELAPTLMIPEPPPAPLVPPPAAPLAPVSPPTPDPKSTPPSGGLVVTSTRASLVIGGYAEVFYQWNFNQPVNGITNYRGFDNRHNSVTIANAALDIAGTAGPVSAHITLQVGHTPEIAYLAEPSSPGTGGAGPSNGQVWKLIQQAVIGYKIPLGRGLLLEGGIYLSPIGAEGLQIKDQWHWSRSNLFFELPYYHTGIRLSYPFTDRLTVTLHANNGWNNVVDNNVPWSFAGQVSYVIPDCLTFNVVYFTGVERATSALEGQPWRHLFDAYALWQPKVWANLGLHLDAGFEPNAFGTSWWSSGAAYLRFRPHRVFYLAGRADIFYEHLAENAAGTAAPIFFPARLVASQTLTAELRPHDNISFWLEYRHDMAAEPMFFTDESQQDVLGNYVPNADKQDTLTLGMVAWF